MEKVLFALDQIGIYDHNKIIIIIASEHLDTVLDNEILDSDGYDNPFDWFDTMIVINIYITYKNLPKKVMWKIVRSIGKWVYSIWNTFGMDFFWKMIKSLPHLPTTLFQNYSKRIPQSFSTDFCDLFSNLFRIWQIWLGITLLQIISDSGYYNHNTKFCQSRPYFFCNKFFHPGYQ